MKFLKSPFFIIAVLAIVGYIVYSFKDSFKAMMTPKTAPNTAPNPNQGTPGGGGTPSGPVPNPNSWQTNFGNCDLSQVDNNKVVFRANGTTVNNTCEGYVIQQKLNQKCPQVQLTLDGDFGPKSQNAFRCFLTSRNLPIKDYTYLEAFNAITYDTSITVCPCQKQ